MANFLHASQSPKSFKVKTIVNAGPSCQAKFELIPKHETMTRRSYDQMDRLLKFSCNEFIENKDIRLKFRVESLSIQFHKTPISF